MPTGPIEKWSMQQETVEMLAHMEKEKNDALRELGHFARNWKQDEASARCSYAAGRQHQIDSLRVWIDTRIRLERAALQQTAASNVTVRTSSNARPADSSRASNARTR